mgnify:CR=1 FL=1
MKPITSKELKEGDIVSTERIFDWIGKDGGLWSSRTIMEVKKIVIKSDNKPDIYVKCWEIIGDEIEIRETTVPYKIGELSLLDGEELINFKKRLILNKLGNENTKKN